MFFEQFQVFNYKCYFEPKAITLGPGINIITGQNNSGKTALLEALSLATGDVPHRSLTTVPVRGGAPVNQTSTVKLSVRISSGELREALIQIRGSASFYLPMPKPDSDFAKALGFKAPDANQDEELLKDWFLNNDHTFFLNRRTGQWRAELPSFFEYPIQRSNDGVLFARYLMSPQGDFSVRSNGYQAQNDADVGVNIGPFCAGRVYMFRAERITGHFQFGRNEILAPNASNLAEVLNNLQSNHASFDSFNGLVREVLPQVQRVSVQQYESNQDLEIRVWSHDYRTARRDLTVPLSACGSGVGQVLAMMYVIFTSDSPKVIIVDEPQSFLHPGAARKLIEVFRRNDQHQFIIATHSPTIIAAAKPKTITMVRQADGKSEIDTLNAKEVEDLRVYLAEIGASLADMYGADRVLWVEGPTERECFPLLATIGGLSTLKLAGTVFEAVDATDESLGKNAERAMLRYVKLSHAGAVLPAAVGFWFDREDRTTADLNDLERIGTQNGFKVRFTRRRTYENYLLNVDAIVAVINVEDGVSEPIFREQVEKIIGEAKDNKKYYRELDLNKEQWLSTINGPLLLKDIFKSAQLDYRKTTHSIALTKWIITNAPNDLIEISEDVVEMLKE